MKKIILSVLPFFLGVILFVTSAFTFEQGVVFKAFYDQNTEYKTVMDIVTSGTMKFDFTKEQEEQLLQSGMTNPMDIEQKMQTTTTISTANRKEDGSMNFVGTTVQGNSIQKIGGQVQPIAAQITNDIEMYGTISKDNIIEIDSISNFALGDEFVAMLSASLKNSQNSVVFPDKPLEIGDSFEQDVPFALPLPGATSSDIQIIMKYKLMKIDGDIAFFDIKQAIKMGMEGEINFDIEGKGVGTCKYSQKEQFVTEIISSLDMKMDMKMQGQSIEANMKMDQVSKTIITHKE